MKKYIFLILFIFPASLFAQEDNNAQLWEKANAFYTTEEYQQAISLYEQILDSGEESAKLYFNLGNAYYKAGDVNNAILNYERAKLLAPNDEDIDFNLQIANQFVVTSIDELPKPFFVRWKQSVVNLYPADTWSLISVSAFVLFLVLLGLYLFGRSISVRRLSFWIGILAVIFSGFTFSFASIQKNKIKTRNHAVVFCPRVTVKSSPAQNGTDLFLIYEGLKVEITDSLSTWKEIRLSDGNEGWLPDSCIVKI
ncbi:tetratricopeptide repeat protein [Maribellus maritimus]|uniref:tetratricopeptide repeat protein n=1 Tax=Maribellus maritimus TaxID=2870838 RepID=UPI001EEB7966|nr:tetratricopeptide repeat protein [Maribellus maritimus]MCG6189203.1 tetratricopeptide repeat protein [Maribellus maritimus]